MKMRDKSRVAEKPVRESGRFDSGSNPGVLIDDGIVVDKDSVALVDEGGGEHVGDGVVGSVDPGSVNIRVCLNRFSVVVFLTLLEALVLESVKLKSPLIPMSQL